MGKFVIFCLLFLMVSLFSVYSQSYPEPPVAETTPGTQIDFDDCEHQTGAAADSCYSRRARWLQDGSLCLKIVNPEKKNVCLSNFPLDSEGNVLCEYSQDVPSILEIIGCGGTEKDRCYYKAATLKRDKSLCDKMSGLTGSNPACNPKTSCYDHIKESRLFLNYTILAIISLLLIPTFIILSYFSWKRNSNWKFLLIFSFLTGFILLIVPIFIFEINAIDGIALWIWVFSPLLFIYILIEILILIILLCKVSRREGTKCVYFKWLFIITILYAIILFLSLLLIIGLFLHPPSFA